MIIETFAENIILNQKYTFYPEKIRSQLLLFFNNQSEDNVNMAKNAVDTAIKNLLKQKHIKKNDNNTYSLKGGLNENT